MRNGVRPIVCERARAQVSRRLDGELSQLETRMLEAHLARCPECAAFDAETTAFTAALRAAPLEPLSRPIAVRAPRRALLLRLNAAAAAVLLVAVAGTVTQLAPRSREAGLDTPDRYATYRQLEREIEQILVDTRRFRDTRGPVVPV